MTHSELLNAAIFGKFSVKETDFLPKKHRDFLLRCIEEIGKDEIKALRMQDEDSWYNTIQLNPNLPTYMMREWDDPTIDKCIILEMQSFLLHKAAHKIGHSYIKQIFAGIHIESLLESEIK